jgi:PurA ssDNA and RNA-binding protein
VEDAQEIVGLVGSTATYGIRASGGENSGAPCLAQQSSRSKWHACRLRLRAIRTSQGPKKFAQNVRIFLPFPKSVAVKSAAQGEMDNIIEAKELQIERKHFYVELRENDRGKFLRITEEAHGRRNSIIVPSTGVDDFTAAISEVLTNNGSAPL